MKKQKTAMDVAMEVALADMRKEFGGKGKRVIRKVKNFKFADYV